MELIASDGVYEVSLGLAFGSPHLRDTFARAGVGTVRHTRHHPVQRMAMALDPAVPLNPASNSDFLELCRAVNLFEVPEKVTACCVLAEGLLEGNPLCAWQAASILQQDELQRVALGVVSANCGSVLVSQDFLCLTLMEVKYILSQGLECSEAAMLGAAVDWVQAQPGDVADGALLMALLPHINLTKLEGHVLTHLMCLLPEHSARIEAALAQQLQHPTTINRGSRNQLVGLVKPWKEHPRVYVYDERCDGELDVVRQTDFRHNLVEFAATCHNNRLYVAGGRNPQGAATDGLHIYDFTLGRWSRGPNMRSARADFCLVTCEDGRLCAIGGGDAANSTCEFLSADGSGWTPGPKLPWSAMNSGAAHHRGALWLVGDPASGNRCAFLQDGADLWEEGPSLNTFDFFSGERPMVTSGDCLTMIRGSVAEAYDPERRCWHVLWEKSGRMVGAVALSQQSVYTIEVIAGVPHRVLRQGGVPLVLGPMEDAPVVLLQGSVCVPLTQ